MSDWREDEEIPDKDLAEDESSEVLLCPSCGGEVYEETEKCPHCGDYITPVHPGGPRKGGWYVALVLFVILAFFLFFVLR